MSSCNLLCLTFHWFDIREPLIVDPQDHITSHDRTLIHAQFRTVRGPEWSRGPAMYIISPADYDTVEDMDGSKVVGNEVNAQQTSPSTNATDKLWTPSATLNFPEKVVLTRAAALAKCSHDHLTVCIMRGDRGNSWASAFQESSQSISSFSALLRVRPCFVPDLVCSSTNADCSILSACSKLDQLRIPFERCLQNRFAGPNELRKRMFKNLVLEGDAMVSLESCIECVLSEAYPIIDFNFLVKHEWDPVRSLVSALRSKYNQYAVFFYNEFAPEIIAIVWRPDAFKPHSFSVGASICKRPADVFWKDDSYVITNTDELMAEVGFLARDIVSNVKVGSSFALTLFLCWKQHC